MQGAFRQDIAVLACLCGSTVLISDGRVLKEQILAFCKFGSFFRKICRACRWPNFV